MDFQITEEQQMIKDMARRFADKVIIPEVKEIDKSGEYPHDIITHMAELGIMGIPFPEEYGGSAAGWVSMALCVEEISRGDPTLGVMLDVTSMVIDEINLFGTREQKQKWLPPLVQGKELGAFALTEPEAGSDAGATRTTAVLNENGWVINGTKQFISVIGYDNASIAIITARTGGQGEGKHAISTFVVPKGAPGFSIGETYDKMSWHHSPTNELIFEDCHLPKENLLGRVGSGFSQHLQVLNVGRISIGAVSVGLAQACFEASLNYARERAQFGQPIYNFQGVSFKIADMAMNIELARNMVLKAAWLKDNNRAHVLEAAYAKLFASEAAEKIASDAVSIHGGYGLINDYPVARYYKGAKFLQIVEGTSEVQRLIITRSL